MSTQDALLAEQRETNRLLKEIAGSLNALLGKPPIRVAWSGAEDPPPPALPLSSLFWRGRG